MSWLNKILGKDNVSQAVVKPASTPPVGTDEALVVAISPNSAGPNQGVTGTVAHDAVGTGVNPVLVGGYSSAAAPSDVSADGDAVRTWFLRNGAQVIQAAFAGILASVNNGAAGTGVQRIAIASDNSAVSGLGAGATGAAVVANAILEGLRAATANPANATGGNLVAAMGDKAGRVVITPGNVRELIGVQTTNIAASTAETTIITAGGAGVFNDISLLVITTTDAAAATITIKDATAGTTRAVFDYPPAAAVPGSALVIPFPIPLPQAAANANWTATVSVNAGSVKITAVFVKNT